MLVQDKISGYTFLYDEEKETIHHIETGDVINGKEYPYIVDLILESNRGKDVRLGPVTHLFNDLFPKPSKTTKVKTAWTVELEKDYQSLHGNIENKMAELLKKEIEEELLKELTLTKNFPKTKKRRFR